MVEHRIELLAPAGSYEGFLSALGAGADAVYVGGTAFGARAYAQNFSKEELCRAIDTAHLYGKKLYLTVNTLLKNREYKEQLYEYMAPFYEAGLDAAIVQDLGVFSFLKEQFPGLPLHASTQMTVTGPEGMRFLEGLGAARVVAARELSLEELSAMHRASPIEIEAFIHGALCYSYSGQCLMSSMFGGRSGNRGRCAQPCRLPYQSALPGRKVKGGFELHPLSLKDICTIDILPEIIKAGVVSLKIEGRMKQPAYTAGVTGMYRKYLDKLLTEGFDTYKVEHSDRKELLQLFSRDGSCRGYYEVQNGPEMLALANQKKVGQPELAPCSLEKISICGVLTLCPGSPASLSVSREGVAAEAFLGQVQKAEKQPMDEARILAQMERLGNTPYEWKHFQIVMDGEVFVPVKVLNELRRTALVKLEEACLLPHRREAPPKSLEMPKAKQDFRNTDRPLYVSCEDADTARLLLKEAEVKGLYLPFDVMKSCLLEGVAAGKEMYVSTPVIVRGSMPKEWKETVLKWLSLGMKGFLVRNLEVYAMLKNMGLAGRCVTDHNLYTWNDKALCFWKGEHILRSTAPLELNEKELLHRNNTDSELLLYGYLPLMTSAQCVRKNLYGCTKKEEILSIRDRKGAQFPVQCCCRPWKADNTDAGRFCYNIIYNSIPFGLLEERSRVKALGMGAWRLSFTLEKPKEALAIFREFRDVYYRDGRPSGRAFTKGHFKRGAE